MLIKLEAVIRTLNKIYVPMVTGKVPFAWSALEYVYHRETCRLLEKRLPGIAEEAGYQFELGVLANLPKEQQETDNAA